MRDIVPDYEFEASKLIFEEILKKSPDSYEANYGLGKLLASENNLEKSLSLLKRTIEITDDDAYKL